jgi:hypothetical protein
VENNSVSASSDDLLVLLDSAIGFDRETTLRSVRQYIKSHPKEAQKTFLKGFRTGRIPDDTLETHTRALIRSKTEPDLAHKVITSFFVDLFNNVLHVFESSVFSSCNCDVAETCENALMDATLWSGYPLGVVKAVLQFKPSKLKSMPDKCLEYLVHQESLQKYEVNISLLSFHEQPVRAWRRFFAYIPDNLFLDPSRLSSTVETRDTWGRFSDVLKAGDLTRIAKDFRNTIESGEKNSSFVGELLLNCVLLGIDMDDKTFVRDTIDFIGSEMPHFAERYRDPLKAGTTISLAHLFLGDTERAVEAIETFSKKHGASEDYTEFIAGFIGSVLAEAGLFTLASKYYWAAFVLRSSPLTWPLYALIEIESQAAQILRETLKIGSIPTSLNKADGLRVIDGVTRALPTLGFKLEHLTSELIALHITSDAKGTADNSEVLAPGGALGKSATGDQFIAASVLEPEAGKLQCFSETINKLEQDHGRAQEKHNLSAMKQAIDGLLSVWQEALSATELIVSDLGSGRDIESLKRLRSGEQIPSLLSDLIREINSLLVDKKKKETEELKNQKAQLLSRLKSVAVEDLVDIATLISLEDVKKALERVTPDLHRAERLREAKKGNVNVSSFMSMFPEPLGRQTAIERILEGVTHREISVNGNILDIIGLLEWTAANSRPIIEPCLAALKGQSKGELLNQDFFLESGLPFIKNIAVKSKENPLTVVLSDAYLARNFLNVLEPSIDNDFRSSIEDFIGPQDKVLQILVGVLNKTGGKATVQEFLLKWIHFCGMKIDEKILLLSSWLSQTHKTPNSWATSNDIELVVQLRDLLAEAGCPAEVMILVSSMWRTCRDPRLLEHFEDYFCDRLCDLVKKGGEARKTVYELLQSPGWIIRTTDGLLSFLYLSYLGGFDDLVEQARSAYFGEFKEVKERHAVLTTECLFPSSKDSRDAAYSGSITEQEIQGALKSLKDFEHDLCKASAYKSWYMAGDYQTFFNKKLRDLCDKILKDKTKDPNSLQRLLDGADPHEWILEADRALDSKAKYQAHESMEKYIVDQVGRLQTLLQAKRNSSCETDVVQYWRDKTKSLKERLTAEFRRFSVGSPRIKRIYDAMLEAIT